MGKVRWLLNLMSHANKQESVENLDINGVAKASTSGFKMPLHYPRYTKEDYEKMEAWRLDLLLSDYGLFAFHDTSLHEKRAFAIETFLWPHHSQFPDLLHLIFLYMGDCKDTRSRGRDERNWDINIPERYVTRRF